MMLDKITRQTKQKTYLCIWWTIWFARGFDRCTRSVFATPEVHVTDILIVQADKVLDARLSLGFQIAVCAEFSLLVVTMFFSPECEENTEKKKINRHTSAFA